MLVQNDVQYLLRMISNETLYIEIISLPSSVLPILMKACCIASFNSGVIDESLVTEIVSL